MDAFLLLANYIHSFLYRLIPVEYLQLWRGFFAGITLLDREALLLGVKVEAKEQSLEYGAMHYRAKVPPNPTQPIDSKYNFCAYLCLLCQKKLRQSALGCTL